ncbi:MAG: Homoserine O-succinyltransferase [Pseudomonadales bacterium]|nr:Homoserine O-succinyltransferase [Pseudomonadales bacterium]
MSKQTPAATGSVGIVAPRIQRFDEALELACGRVLPSWELVYETYGTLNEDRSNAVLICHALSGNHHAAGFHSSTDRKPGWWDNCIGPGKPIDTRRFFVVALNNLGGCAGSTGPRSVDPATGRIRGPEFPLVRVRDWVATQRRLADVLGIGCWAAVIGGSLGGMQAMRWAIDHPERVRHCVVIAAALKLSAQNLAFNEIARKAIMADPQFHDGWFLEHGTLPRQGLAIARMIGHVTYLSDELMGDKFGRELRSGSFAAGGEAQAEFQVQSYLRYQGDQFADNFDANTYLLMTRALDYFDLARDHGDDPVAAFRQARCRFLVMAFSSDWRFAPQRSREIVDALVGARREVSYVEIEANEGHDAFLLPITRYHDALRRYLERVVPAANPVRGDVHAS